jgi:hypothetical protein
LVKIWEIFDYPCSQRLKPVLEPEVKRLRDLGEIFLSNEVEEKLKYLYLSLNPAELKRKIDAKLKRLYQIYQDKNQTKEIKPMKKLRQVLVRNYIIQKDVVSGRIVKLVDRIMEILIWIVFLLKNTHSSWWPVSYKNSS